MPNKPYKLVMRTSPKITIMHAAKICPINFLEATNSTMSSFAPNMKVKHSAAKMNFISLVFKSNAANKQKAIIKPPKIATPPNVGVTP